MKIIIEYETDGTDEIAMRLSIHTMIENRYPECKIEIRQQTES